MTPRAILLAWAESGGFAATHGAGATNEAIVDDLLAYLAHKHVAIVPRHPTPAMIEAGTGPSAKFDEPLALAAWRAMVGAAT